MSSKLVWTLEIGTYIKIFHKNTSFGLRGPKNEYFQEKLKIQIFSITIIFYDLIL